MIENPLSKRFLRRWDWSSDSRLEFSVCPATSVFTRRFSLLSDQQIKALDNERQHEGDEMLAELVEEECVLCSSFQIQQRVSVEAGSRPALWRETICGRLGNCRRIS